MRIWLFRLLAVGLGFSLVGVAELLLRFFPGLNPPPFLETLAEHKGRQLRRINPLYPKRFFFQRYQGKFIASGQMYPRPYIESAPSESYRVIFLGASTVKGYPYPRSLAAAAFLEAMLEDAWPERKLQVFNLGITSLASFAVVQVLKDAMVLAPDLVVVYTGHNEFYGVYGAGTHPTPFFNRLHYTLMQLRTARLLRSSFDLFRGSAVSSTPLVEIMARRGEVPLGSARRSAAQNHLRENLREISRECARYQVPLIFCTLVANETGFAPAGSATPQLEDEQRAQYQEWIEEAAEKVLQDSTAPGAAEVALGALDRAAELSAEHAWLWYLQGRALASLGKSSAARRAFRQARELDTMPWRAPRAHSQVIRAVARETKAGLADVEAAFERASPAEGVGWELIVDHVHPSVEGQILLARTVLETMEELLVAEGNAINGNRLRSDGAYRALLGDLPAGSVRVYRGIGELLSLPPLDRYNAHNAIRFRRLAAEIWQALSEAEKRGYQQKRTPQEEVPLALNVANQLFATRDFAAAEKYYAASRREAPYTLLGDLWAAVRWAHSIQRLGEEFTPEQRATLKVAQERCELTILALDAPLRYSDFFKGLFCYFLEEHEPALEYLERAFLEAEIRQQFGQDFFPALAEELIRAGRLEDARRYARQVGSRESQYFRLLVEMFVQQGGGTESSP